MAVFGRLHESERELLVFVVVDDVPARLPESGALVVQRRFGIDPQTRADVLRSVVREDPDTMVIADVGSRETFELALRAAEGGRLVVAYLDAQNVVSALNAPFPSNAGQMDRNDNGRIERSEAPDPGYPGNFDTYDRDGDEDMFVTGGLGYRNGLLRNDAGTFTDVTGTCGVHNGSDTSKLGPALAGLLGAGLSVADRDQVQHGLHARNKLAGAERLGHIINSTQLKSLLQFDNLLIITRLKLIN